MGLVDAMRTWDPDRGVPFSNFAWLCSTREARNAVHAARATSTTCSPPPHRSTSPTATAKDGTRPATRRPAYEASAAPPPTRAHRSAAACAARGDHDPVAKTLAREQLRGADRPHAHALAARATRARARQQRPLAHARSPPRCTSASAPSTTRSSARATSSASSSRPRHEAPGRSDRRGRSQCRDAADGETVDDGPAQTRGGLCAAEGLARLALPGRSRRTHSRRCASADPMARCASSPTRSTAWIDRARAAWRPGDSSTATLRRVS